MKDEHGEIVSTARFLKELDRDQLYRCVEMAQQRITSIENEKKRSLWRVTDEAMILKEFPEDQFVQAAAFLAEYVKREYSDGQEGERMTISRHRLPESEYNEAMESWK